MAQEIVDGDEERSSINLGDIVALLNEDLKLEYAAAIQYFNHAAMLRRAEVMHIASVIKGHGDEEIGHAQILCDLINYYGGSPAVEIGETKTSPDNMSMLRQDLDAELNAINRYTDRIEQAQELNLFPVVKALLSIISDEQDHALEVKTALGE